jgi:predicted PolB exonuclease-like 3'-5' exonuclease
MSGAQHCLVFDIETVPDAELGRKIGEFEGDDMQVAAEMIAKRKEETESGFLPLEQHRVVAISTLLRSGDQLQVWSLGAVDSPEDDLLRRFFGGIDKLRPTLVSWNGSGFDLPVLHYRMLRHGIASPTYWDTGELDRDFKWNNYLNRFHMRHVDLMDVLAAYQGRGRASLDHVALLLGQPGKLGMSGDQVFDYWRAGRIAEIRSYCETDVFNTYLIWLRFELIRGQLTSAEYDSEIARARAWLGERSESHWRQYAAAWVAD